MGDEEATVLTPAINLVKREGIDVSGPLPADTLFSPQVRKDYDVIICCYHDQGLIPLKLLGWREAVSVTPVLPTIRTSPDHGTAFDIAGKNRADASSFAAAVALAIDLANQRAAAENGRRFPKQQQREGFHGLED